MTIRALIEVELMTAGIPFEAIASASEQRVGLWYAAAQVLKERART